MGTRIYDPLLRTSVPQQPATTLLSRCQSHACKVWEEIEPVVCMGVAVGLCWAAWRYYERKSSLRTYGRYITGKTAGPVVGREDEIDRVTSILCRKTKNCAALVGAPGVGKTAIAEGLAQRIAAGNVPPELRVRVSWRSTSGRSCLEPCCVVCLRGV